MESSSGEGKMAEQQPPKRRKGGMLTMPFIIANEAFEKVASYGLLPNMIQYLIRDYNFGVAKGTNALFLWSSATNFTPLFGAFLSDSYLGRFLTIIVGSIISLLGMILLWLTAMLPKVKPPPCNPLNPQTCKSATPSQYTLLYSSFALMSVGAGGIRPCSLAFGADQFDNQNNPKNEKVLESYFGWYYASATIAVLIALTAIVYIQDHKGWKVGFGVPVILMFFSALLFVLASPLYIKQKVKCSLFSSFAQVIVVTYKNRKLAIPPQNSGQWYHPKDSDIVVPSDKLRFFNKACIKRNPTEINPDPWSLCTVEQVEELKSLIKVVPMWSTGIMPALNISQISFPLLQASSMDRHVTSSFQIPAGSFGMFTIITITVWVIVYDRAILPLASKIRGKTVHIGVKQRMGTGLLFSCMAMAVSAIVEHVRRKKAIEQGFQNSPHAVLNMSAMWLVPQHCISGLAEALNAIGQTEFYYTEFPKSMSSVASSLFGLTMAAANLLASVVLSAVDNVTKGDGNEGWISSNINKGHYEYYYWLLAILSSINLLYFLVCSWAYGPTVDDIKRVGNDEKTDLEMEEKMPKLGNGVRDGRETVELPKG
ncbi:hypothetical protein RJ639_040895 [Escallonia herrerae]|uniref:Uncharacterized protein n=1 Tax=Escallonia herrerae TaxID=1293975 RepID=A0AA88WH69_9ASTE|nr:hypothetical protein RJ639_040895 [Escallonia herrerae]